MFIFNNLPDNIKNKIFSLFNKETLNNLSIVSKNFNTLSRKHIKYSGFSIQELQYVFIESIQKNDVNTINIINLMMADKPSFYIEIIDMEKAGKIKTDSTLLYDAVKNQSIEIVHLLLTYGANPDVLNPIALSSEDKEDRDILESAICLAAINKNAAIVKLLITYGADRNLFFSERDHDVLSVAQTFITDVSDQMHKDELVKMQNQIDELKKNLKQVKNEIKSLTIVTPLKTHEKKYLKFN